MVHNSFVIELVNTFFNCGAKVRQYFLVYKPLSLNFFLLRLWTRGLGKLPGEKFDGFFGSLFFVF